MLSALVVTRVLAEFVVSRGFVLRHPRLCFISDGRRASSQVRTRPCPAIPLSRGCRSTKPRETTNSASTRVTTRADSMDASTPMLNVTPKPRTGPAARKKSSPAANRVVMFESAIADSAFWKPLRSERRRPSVRPEV